MAKRRSLQGRRTKKQLSTTPPARNANSTYALAETRGVKFLTIGWMFTVMATLAMVVGYALVRIFNSAAQPGEELLQSLAAFGDFLFMTAIVAGIVSLVLAVIVYRSSQTKPPLSVVRVAVGIGLLPLLVLLVQAMGV